VQFTTCILVVRDIGTIVNTPQKQCMKRKFSSNASLVQLQVFHRHGDRTPFTKLRNVDFWWGTLPNNTRMKWLCAQTRLVGLPKGQQIRDEKPFGALTNRGIDQLVDVGGYLSLKYPGRFSDMEVWCTRFRRTIQSVQGLIRGLHLNAEEVDIDLGHTSIMIPDDWGGKNASKGKGLDRQFWDSDDIVNFMSMNKDLFLDTSFRLFEDGFITEETREEQMNWNRLHEIVHCLREYGLLPPSIPSHLVDTIENVNRRLWFSRLSHSFELNRIVIGGFPDHIESVFANQNDQRTRIYSCHDTSLIGLMCALGLDPRWPPYATCLELALNSDGNVEAFINREPCMFVSHQTYEIPLKDLRTQIREGISFAPEYAPIYRFENKQML